MYVIYLATLCWQVLLEVMFEPFNGNPTTSNVYFCHRCWQFIRNHNTWSVACCVLHWFRYRCHLHHIHQEKTRCVNTSLYNHFASVVWNILFSVCDWFEHSLLSPWHHHHHVLVYVCIYTVIQKRCHPNYGRNFVSSWSICKILSLLQRALDLQ